MPNTEQRIIYDFGANNGDDVDYYLKKADLVVAVEANPLLTRQIERRFEVEIRAGRLILENKVLVADSDLREVAFYLHKTNHVLSQLPRPTPELIQDFEVVVLPTIDVVDLIRQNGEPFYIKIDVEHYDAEILRALFNADIKPPFISAESHAIEVFSLLLCLGGYRSFKLVDGKSVSTHYCKHCIQTAQGDELHSFPYHSAGPFGDDVIGPWLTADNFFRLLANEGLGWKDVHATSAVEADPLAQPRTIVQSVSTSQDETVSRADQ